ncbi:MAG: sensor histidine kinase [Halopseudomonas sp.]
MTGNVESDGASRPLMLLWRRYSLAQRFAATSFVVIVAGSIVIGLWVSMKIESSVTHDTALTTALYMNSLIAPEIQELSQQDQLSAKTIATLNHLHHDTPLGEGIVSFKVWAPGGRIVYSTTPTLIGQNFPESDELQRAWMGEVTSELSTLDSEENKTERQLNTPLIELYSPIRAHGNDKIIAVAEFYKNAQELESQLFEAKVSSWLVVYGVTFSMFVLLYGIVRRGSQTISMQRGLLETKIDELSSLLEQNKILNDRVRRASYRTTEINERVLRRFSADLHDGPAQSVGFALLRIDALLAEKQSKSALYTSGEAVREALTDALQEIRNLSAGFALPELEHLSLQQVIERVVRAHQRRTGSPVQVDIDELPKQLSMSTKIAVYRLLQESLNNTYEHADGIKQGVRVWMEGETLKIEVADAGPGFEHFPPQVSNERLGVLGMRERIESLGGHFSIDSALGKGTRIRAVLPINAEGEDHAA